MIEDENFKRYATLLLNPELPFEKVVILLYLYTYENISNKGDSPFKKKNNNKKIDIEKLNRWWEEYRKPLQKIVDQHRDVLQTNQNKAETVGKDLPEKLELKDEDCEFVKPKKTLNLISSGKTVPRMR